MSSSANKITLITVGSTVTLSVLGTAAQANTTGTAADLLPLDTQGVPIATASYQLKALKTTVSATIKPEVAYHPELLNTVASNINGSKDTEEEDDTPDIGDVIDLSFVEQFIDEDGDINLPLGITVYEAMGMTSIGFGGEFR